MEFEKAAALRDQVKALKDRYGAPGASATSPGEPGASATAPAAPAKPKKVRRSELEEVLSNKKPAKRPGTPGVRANKRKKGGGRRFD
jgi:hypothetical protein